MSDFFEVLTISELAERQGVKPLSDPSHLACEAFADEDVDEFLRQIGRS